MAKERFWRKALARFAASDLSPKEFCEKEGLSPDVLRYWRDTIARRDAERLSTESMEQRPGDVRFVPMLVAGPSERMPGTRQIAVAEIVFHGGAIALFNGITAETVRALLIAISEGAK